MTRRLSVREARAHFADVLGSVYHTNEAVIVERNGKPVAVLVSPDEYERLCAKEAPAAASAATMGIVDSIRGVAGTLPRPMEWREIKRIAREDYVFEKARKKGLI